VFATIGNVGTPTAKVTVPYALEHRYLFFAPFTGAGLLRQDPPDRYVFNYRASYADETAAMVRYFVDMRQISPQQIAVFAQNDAYGDDGFHGVIRALRKYDVREEDVLRVSYDRNSLQVTGAVEEIEKQQDRVRAIVMVPTYAAAARFVSQLKTRGLDLQFAAVSFVGSDLLAEEFRAIGPEYAEGVIVTQVVPHFRSGATGVLRYREALKKHFPEAHPGFVSLEGFIAAECLLEGLRRAGPKLTTESLIDALESVRDLDLGIGPVISFAPSKHQASSKVWGTVLDSSATFQMLELE
jgi:ABC-type branched-subunit amino acid transport system substrate-binding protein